jgi:hypothetical protein
VRRRPNCGGGELKIIAAMLERAVIEKILSHLGLDPQPPPRVPARELVEHQASRAALPQGKAGWSCMPSRPPSRQDAVIEAPGP